MTKMESIERISKIDKSKLSEEYYLQSLSEEALLCGLLSDADIEKIQFDCLSVLAKQTQRYNNGDSSSVRVETAQNLLSSILYTIGIQLKTCACPDDAVTLLQSESAEMLFTKGLKQINSKIVKVKLFHAQIVRHLIESPNVFYRSTVVDGINGFFKLYRPEYGANEIHITADYPTCNGVYDLAGIEFIQKYLQNIYCENLFCSEFSSQNIHHLLRGYEKNYQNLLFNLYEPVLTSAVGCILAGRDARSLSLSLKDTGYLNGLFSHADEGEAAQILMEALDKLCIELSLPRDVSEYAKMSMSRLSCSVLNAVRRGNADKVFIVPSCSESNPAVTFSIGKRMNDALYRKTVDKVIACNFSENKAAIIRSSIHSLVDLNDILSDAELSENDIVTVLKMLSPEELAALIKINIVGDDAKLSDIVKDEASLCNTLKNYISSLPHDQQNRIKAAVETLKVE